MSDLVRYYKEYYREQTVKAFDDLYKCMLDYDFVSYHLDVRKILSMRIVSKCLGPLSPLKSSGSSGGTSREYLFGPNFDAVRLVIESKLRDKNFNTLLLTYSKNSYFIDKGIPAQYDFQFGLPLDNVVELEKTISGMDRLLANHGLINILALPSFWIRATSHPVFLNWLDSNFSRINSLTNTDCNPCFRKTKCRVLDQMIDWETSLNFWTCKFGHYHFLPLFVVNSDGTASSLINLNNSSRRGNDLVSMGERVVCECGAPRIEFSAVTHWKNYPLDLDGRYVCGFDSLFDACPDFTEVVQIYQSLTGECSLFYHSKIECDLSEFTKIMGDMGLGKIKIVSRRYFTTGTKRPPFWRGGNPLVKDIE